MDVYELTEKLGGEFVRGKARFRQGNEYIVIGFANGDNMIFTEEGRRLAAEHSGIVESVEVAPVEVAPVEVADVLSDIQAALAAVEQVTEDVPFPTSEPESQTGLI